MIIRGYVASRITGDIFAVQMDPSGAIIGAFGPIKEEEAVPWEIDRPFAYSTSIGELIEGNRDEFQVLYLKGQDPGHRGVISPGDLPRILQKIEG